MAAFRRCSSRIYIYAALSTLDNLLKSGGVGWATALAGRILGIKPVLSLRQGVVRVTGEHPYHSGGATDSPDRSGDAAHAPGAAGDPHTDNLAAANELKSVFAPVFPLEQILVVNVNPSLGTHVGAKGLGVALITRT